MDKKFEEALLFLTCLVIQLLAPSLLCLIRFPIKESIDSFVVAEECFVLNIAKFVPYIGIKMLIGHK